MPQYDRGEFSDPTENIILRKKYRGGLGSPQKGQFMVMATFLDMEGKPKGGGWVESFDSKKDAEDCVQEINGINTSHEPKICPVKE
ncbi:MAG: hypothetical protein HY569_01010 [Candidatus Magasanikbacteria bacterium]|nr:hypothetical protein [Candidatus Magasanikbacteria bacterium]